MSEPVHVTRALLVALLEEIGDDDPCGRAIIETAIRLGDELAMLVEKVSTSRSGSAIHLLSTLDWPEAPQ
jgi:hypothetical protein